MARLPFESEYLYGFHDPGGEQLMRDAGRKGWILFTEEIGHDPSHEGGSGRYAGLAGEGFGIMVRLNNGYYNSGTIPRSSEYERFAQRCGHFARNSPGAKIWIVGNETNFSVERPGVEIDWTRDLPQQGGEGAFSHRAWRDQFTLDRSGSRPRALLRNPGEAITPERYARCYALCRDAIHSQPGHADDLVLTSAVAPWNIDTSYGGNANGDWVQYFRGILTMLGPGGCDGITLHTYTHGSDPALIEQDIYMGSPGFQHRHYDFRTYVDYMEAIPANMRHLPVYITEADEDIAWDDGEGSVWVQRAYAEIDRWNRQPGHQQIRSLILYRWPRVGGADRWWIEGKGNVIADIRRAMEHGYRWRAEAEVVQPSTFTPGQEVQAVVVVNVRRAPGHLNQPVGDVLGQFAPGARVTILGPSQQADGLTWWPVRGVVRSGETVEGWTAQVAPGGQVLLRR